MKEMVSAYGNLRNFIALGGNLQLHFYLHIRSITESDTSIYASEFNRTSRLTLDIVASVHNSGLITDSPSARATSVMILSAASRAANELRRWTSNATAN